MGISQRFGLLGSLMFLVISTQAQIESTVSSTEQSPTVPIPDYLIKCPRGKNSASCVQKGIQRFGPYMKKGLPDVNIPSADPMFIPLIIAERGAGGPVQFKAAFKNIKVHGLSNFTCTYARTDRNKGTFDFGTLHPRMNLDLDYEISGKLLLLPIRGSGDGWVKLSNVVSDIKCTGGIIKRDGKSWIDIRTVKIHYELGDVSLHLNNLFNGDKLLGTTMNRFINENWPEILHEARGTAIGAIETILRNLMRNVFSKYAVEDITYDPSLVQQVAAQT